MLLNWTFGELVESTQPQKAQPIAYSPGCLSLFFFLPKSVRQKIHDYYNDVGTEKNTGEISTKTEVMKNNISIGAINAGYDLSDKSKFTIIKTL